MWKWTYSKTGKRSKDGLLSSTSSNFLFFTVTYETHGNMTLFAGNSRSIYKSTRERLTQEIDGDGGSIWWAPDKSNDYCNCQLESMKPAAELYLVHLFSEGMEVRENMHGLFRWLAETKTCRSAWPCAHLLFHIYHIHLHLWQQWQANPTGRKSKERRENKPGSFFLRLFLYLQEIKKKLKYFRQFFSVLLLFMMQQLSRSIRGTQWRFPPKYIESSFYAVQSTFTSQEIHS